MGGIEAFPSAMEPNIRSRAVDVVVLDFRIAIGTGFVHQIRHGFNAIGIQATPPHGFPHFFRFPVDYEEPSRGKSLPKGVEEQDIRGIRVAVGAGKALFEVPDRPAPQEPVMQAPQSL